MLRHRSNFTKKLTSISLQAILSALAQQGVLSDLKVTVSKANIPLPQIRTRKDQTAEVNSPQAQLRSSVFAAINEEHGGPPRSGQLQWLLSSEEGASLAALVQDFLRWAGLRHTSQVICSIVIS